MTVGPAAEHTPAVPAGSLLMLLAEREARAVAASEGTLPGDAVERWGEGLTSPERQELARFDRLCAAIRAGLEARRSGA